MFNDTGSKPVCSTSESFERNAFGKPTLGPGKKINKMFLALLMTPFDKIMQPKSKFFQSTKDE